MTCRGPALSDVEGARAELKDEMQRQSKQKKHLSVSSTRLERGSAEHQCNSRQSMSTTELLLVQQDAGIGG